MFGIGLQELLILAVIFGPLGLIPAFIAQHKGANFGQWWVYGALLFPIALIHELVRKPNARLVEAQRLQSGEGTRCPFCAETIKAEVRVCRYCGRDV
jgi:hypothetical protein